MVPFLLNINEWGKEGKREKGGLSEQPRIMRMPPIRRVQTKKKRGKRKKKPGGESVN